MSLYLITPPSALVVSVADMKEHLRVDHADDDDLIEAMILAATAHIDGSDGVLQRAIVSQTWELRLDSFWSWCRPWSSYLLEWSSYSSYIELPLPPLISVASVKYIDANGAEQTYDAASYHVVGVANNHRSRIQLRDTFSWPTVATNWPEPVKVRFTAGYVDASNSPPTNNVPTPIVQAIKLIVGHHYANRETVSIGSAASEIPMTAEWLLAPYKVFA